MEAFNHKTEGKQLKHLERLVFDKGRLRFTAAGTLLRHADLHWFVFTLFASFLISDITTIDLLVSYRVFLWQPHC